MIFKSLALIGLIGGNVAAANLRADANELVESDFAEHLDLEVEVDGKRELFPLLPGTKCPTGHVCRVRSSPQSHNGMSPMLGAIKDNYKNTLTETVDWQELNSNFNTLVVSNNFCTRRAAMARAAGLAAGVAASTVSQPAYAAETKEVKMGSDSGLLAFVPKKVEICKGDSVTWINNKGGPHNVVFDEDGIPDGVSQEAISMDEQLGEEGDTYTKKFDTAGEYAYYCEPHRGAGMEGILVVV
mmetsp:Transcript_91532/g.186310  ORF Transcript_91532/g.186310 Transcript_91532/m.186310 type:complete len:242 (+) Transcript_91532:87-812(+)|eukprot:CAMPEP_0201203572 /NCGR_PEP_ID=MMETSP0851-20130426/167333_1 /ASSEMBLY_ACC=CAM_ASM_000631 /TAXON_ID=183588 /ORGANISM="Pseudo-nitzschia fraudulenta, Strain WWA7" /LENGTH=241 /DNA_ID=CAMNT_0047491573 /DNA_START=78 /DNA_END=803 /DNA_ORIENTATION=+